MVPLLTIILLLLSLQADPNHRQFLRELVGCWTSTGQMGDLPLAQRAEGRMVLGQHFLEMKVFDDPNGPSERGGKGYEAIYLIGFDQKAGQYVMNLFDTFGVTTRPIPGVGTRSANSVEFTFPYEAGQFRTRITLDATRQRWTMQQRQLTDTGGERQFATKHWEQANCS